MSRPADRKKLAGWRKRLERFAKSGLAVKRFCARERVSVASFYHWRKKLGHQGRRRRMTAGRGGFQKLAVVPVSPGMVPASPVVWIELACGTRIEMGGDLDAVRAVIAEVVRADRHPDTTGGDRSEVAERRPFPRSRASHERRGRV